MFCLLCSHCEKDGMNDECLKERLKERKQSKCSSSLVMSLPSYVSLSSFLPCFQGSPASPPAAAGPPPCHVKPLMTLGPVAGAPPGEEEAAGGKEKEGGRRVATLTVLVVLMMRGRGRGPAGCCMGMCVCCWGEGGGEMKKWRC